MQPAHLRTSITYILLSRHLNQRLCGSYAFYLLRRVHNSRSDISSSDKLFADAAKEDELEKREVKRASKLSQLEGQQQNWTGDESIKDSVLRMLMDKYKPLRTGTIQSADDKLKRTPPKVVASSSTSSTIAPLANILKPSTGSWATEPLLRSNPNHEPWHTEFKAPSHHVSSIRLAQMPPPVSSSPPSPNIIDGQGTTGLDRQTIKRTRQVGRLTEARESTIDYRLGIKKPTTIYRRPNAINIKGWTSLVEDRIETARKTGYFKDIKGKGRPLVRTTEESNPFISREEFLMNRIVHRNGASPPWIEVQGELDNAVTTFREILKQSYIRRVVRILASHLSAARLAALTLDDIKAHKDSEWVEREKGYHEAAIEDLNKLVRKYNGMAPYAARRGYYLRKVEVGKLGEECAQGIMDGLKERLDNAALMQATASKEGQPSGTESQHIVVDMIFTLCSWLKALWRRIFRVR